MRILGRRAHRRTSVCKCLFVIQFLNADHPYRLREIKRIRAWLQDVISGYDKQEGEISVVFCSDDYLLKINQESLNHHDFTDIITFDYCVGDIVSGDLFISVPRVQENGRLFRTGSRHEMCRVIVHGILHLIGFQDKTDQTQATMREAENRALAELFHVKH